MTNVTKRVVAIMVMAASCDRDSGVPDEYDFSIQLDGVFVVSAWPATRSADGNWERVCDGGTSEGMVADFAVRGRGKEGSYVSVAPGDTVHGAVIDHDLLLSGRGAVDLMLDGGNGACAYEVDDGTPTQHCAPMTTDTTRYVAHGDAVDVVVLVENAGSMGGVVEDGTFRESNLPDPFPENFSSLGSDVTGQRGVAARNLLELARRGDSRFVVAGFNSARTRVACAEPATDLGSDILRCLDLPVSEYDIDALQSSSEGHSNLWTVASMAYDVLRQVAAPGRSRHIVIISDGPDTCTGAFACEPGCEGVDGAAFIDLVAHQSSDDKVQVHVIQFESIGYPGHDPRQVEAACVSGGHYAFIGSNGFPRGLLGSPGALGAAFARTTAGIAAALDGHWRVATSGELAATLPEGTAFGVHGRIAFQANGAPTASEAFAAQAGLFESHPSDDERWSDQPTLLRPCTTGGCADGECCDGICRASCEHCLP